MSTTVTPLHALKRLRDIVSQLDAAECPALYNQIQGELAVSDMVLRDVAPIAAQPAQQVEAVGQAPVAWIAPHLLASLQTSREYARVPSNHSVAVQAAQRETWDLPLYTADQLRAAVLAEREACAKLVEDHESDWPGYIAECIRARK